MSEEGEELKKRINRLRYAIRKLDEGYNGEYGGGPSTPEQIEADDWLELDPGDMTEDAESGKTFDPILEGT